MTHCYMCGGTNDVRFCNLCQHWLCASCRHKPVARAQAAGRDWLSRLRDWWQNSHA